MNEKKIGIVLVIINIVFLVALGFFYVEKDREAPLLVLEEVYLVYEEGMPEEQLLQGVSAVDKKDGDISHSIVIEKIVTDSAQELAVITYGVMDQSGNTAKSSRTVKMLVQEEQESAEEEADSNQLFDIENQVSNEEEADANMEEDLNEEISSNEEVSSDNTEQSQREEGRVQEEVQRQPSPQNTVSQQSVNSQEMTVPVQPEIQTPDNNVIPQETMQQALPTAGEAGNDQQVLTPEQKKTIAPELVFSSDEVYTTKGYNPAWVTVIGKLADNKDSYEYLFETLKITGTYDRNTSGNYDVMVSVRDSDGNETTKPIRIVVGE